MNAKTTGAGGRQRSKWWWFVLALGVVGVGYLLHAVVAPRRALEAARSRLQAAGERLTIEECVGPRVPEHEAAARRFLAAAQSLSSRGRGFPDSAPRAMEMVAPGKARVGWRQPELPASWVSRYSPSSSHPSSQAPELLVQRYGLRTAPPIPGAPPTVGEASRPPPPPRVTWEDLAADLQACGPALKEISDVTKVAGFDWNLDHSQGFEMLRPHLVAAKPAVQRLQAATLSALHEGRRDDALEFLETQLRIVRNLPRNGMLIDELVRIAMGASAWNATWEILQADGWTDGQLRRLQQAWQETEFIECMIRGLEMERALVLREYARCRKDPGRLGLRGTAGTASPAPPIRSPSDVLEWMKGLFRSGGGQGMNPRFWAWFRSWDDERCYLEATQTIIEKARVRSALGRPPHALPLSLPAGEAFVPKGALSASAQLQIRRHLLAAVTLSTLDKPMAKAFRSQMQREMVLTAIALKRHQLQHGALPENLAELVPALLSHVPMDWMDGQPLRYRPLEGQRFLLYSVSDDGIDQGGDPSTSGVLRRSVALEKGRDFVWPEAVSP